MPEIAYAERADLDSIYADEDRSALIEATQSDQAGRHAEILWLEQKLIGPLRPYKEDRLGKALANTEAVYEAQWRTAIQSCRRRKRNRSCRHSSMQGSEWKRTIIPIRAKVS
jgi:hypothetical protein